MECTMLKGAPVAKECLSTLIERIDELKSHHTTPALRVILVGEDPASKIYTQRKAKKCIDMGIDGEVIHIPQDTTTEALLSRIQALNRDDSVHGILVQLPLPSHIDNACILESIAPEKDVDGFHSVNVGKLQKSDSTALVPCTALGIITLLEFYALPIEGQHVVVLGRSNIVGKPIAQILSSKAPHGNATVTVCHSRTPDISHFTRDADIVIAAMGLPLFLTEEKIKEGAVLIDVGITPTPKDSHYYGTKKIVGDVDPDSVRNKASALTPVPGGIGPMTIAMLMHNTVQAAEQINTHRNTVIH